MVLDPPDCSKVLSETIEHDHRTVAKERIVKTYNAGKTVVQGTRKTTIVTKRVVARPISDLKSAVQTSFPENWDFEIYEDGSGDDTTFDADSGGYSAFISDKYDDKENKEPVIIGGVENLNEKDLKFLGDTGKELYGNRASSSEE